MYWFHLSVGWYISQLTEQALFGQYNNLKTPSWTCIKLGSKEDKLYDFEIKDRQYTGFFHPNSSFLRLLYRYTVMKWGWLYGHKVKGRKNWHRKILSVYIMRTFCLTCQTSHSGNPQGIKDPFDSEVNTLSI